MDDFHRAGAGVVADISEPHERGTFFGFMGIGPMVGPCLGPGKPATFILYLLTYL